jgi:GMP synthase (glutamine-hydrolysing)
MVTDNLQWSVNIEQWIRKAINHPIYILGICYGHQLIGKALGGYVDNNPKGKEIGTVTIFSKDEINKDPLFKDTPLDFKAHVTHMQSVLTLPKGAKSLASNPHDENQIVRFSEYIWGVQFHPEFDETIMQEYIKEQEKELNSLGFDINKLLPKVNKTTYANTLIDKFVQLLKNKS